VGVKLKLMATFWVLVVCLVTAVSMWSLQLLCLPTVPLNVEKWRNHKHAIFGMFVVCWITL